MSAPPRPSSVTSACLFVGLSCVILLVSVVQALGSWGSIEAQEQLAAVLDEQPLSGMGLSMDQALDTMRAALYVAALVCLLGVVFAIYTFRGHGPSRFVLTVVCALAAVGFILTGLIGILLAAFVLSSAFMLWSPESRDWFALKNGRTPPVRAQRPASRVDAVAPSAVAPGRPEAPAGPAAPAASAPQPTPRSAGAAGRQRIPREVLIASVTTLVTWLTVGFVALMIVLSFIFTTDSFADIAASDPALAEQVETLRDTIGDVAPSWAVAALVVGVMSLVAAVAAVAGMLRRSAGRAGMVMLSYGGIVLSALVLPVGLPWAAAAVITIVLLNRPVARAWFAGA